MTISQSLHLLRYCILVYSIHVCVYISFALYIYAIVQCSLDNSLSSPDHSLVTCPLVHHVIKISPFSCDQEYQLNGLSSIHCLSNGSWSRFSFTSDILHCGNISDVVDLNNTEFSSINCRMEYSSQCTVYCKQI